ncbi:hypothetical protein COLO4_30950, partial [Corchorus olitorius]
MERGGGYRGRGTGGRGGGYRGGDRGRGRGMGRGRGRDGDSGGDQPSYQRVSGQGQGGFQWNQTNSQVGPDQGTGPAPTRAGHTGGGRGGRGMWLPRPHLQEGPSLSNVPGSARHDGGAGGSDGGPWRRQWGTGPAQSPGPQIREPALTRPTQPLS